MEDAIALAAALGPALGPPALAARGRPAAGVESLQRAAQASLEWFESVERYQDTEPLQFAFSLLTRSLRITHENLRLRDPALVAKVDRWFAGQAARRSRASRQIASSVNHSDKGNPASHRSRVSS
jgi:anthraniloyl-CoA monooxygenase